MKRYLSIILALLFAVPAYGQSQRIRDLTPITAAEITDDTTVLFGTDRTSGSTPYKLSLAELRKKTDVRAVANVAAFASVTADEGQIFITRGYSTAGIGSGIYRYHATGRPTADSVLYFDAAGADDYLELLHNGVIDVTQAGVIPESSDSGVMTANLAAITALMGAVDENGCTVTLPPKTWISVNGAWPMPSGDVGGTDTVFPLTINGQGSTIKQTGTTSPLFTITRDSASFDPTVIVPQEQARRVIRDLFISSSSTSYAVDVTKCGKDIHFENVWISAPSGAGLRINETYGGYFANVYVYKCGSHGVVISDCNVLTLPELTTRQNGGSGLVVTDSTSLCGSVYSESNDSWGVDADSMLRSNLKIYTEANHYNGSSAGSRYRQNRLRESYANAISGVTQSDWYASFDMDDISRTGNLIGSFWHLNPMLPRPIVTKQHVSLRHNFAANYSVGFVPTITRTSNGNIELLVPEDANENQTGSNNWWSITQNSGGVTIDEWGTVSFSAGDQFLVTMRVDYDDAALSHFQTMNDDQENHTRAFYVSVACGATTAVVYEANVSGARSEFYSIPFTYPVGETADPIVYLFPCSTGANQPGPAADIKLTFSELSIRRLADSNVVDLSTEIVTPVDGDTTPDVSGVRVVKHANTSPTTVGDYDNAVDGQLLEVHVDGNTTLDDSGGNFKFDSSIGGTFNGGSGGKVITLRLIDGVWTQTGYNVDF